MRSRSASSSVENRGHSFEKEQQAPQLWQRADASACMSVVLMGGLVSRSMRAAPGWRLMRLSLGRCDGDGKRGCLVSRGAAHLVGQRPVGQGLGEMHAADLVGAVEIGERACHPQHPVIAARREMHRIGGVAQER